MLPMMTLMKGKLVQSLHLFIMLLQCLICAEAGAMCLENERQALLRLKQGLTHNHAYLSSWKNDEDNKDCCNWIGISCSNRTGHVTAVDLSSADVFVSGGNISSSLLELSHLAYLDLSVNDFGGQKIPDFIGSLNNLRYLNLSYGSFGGKIPYQLGNLSRLQTLDLSNNFNLYADKLEWLSPLSKLEHLILNFLYMGEATDWLRVVVQLHSLTELWLKLCDLPKIVPSSVSFVNASKSLSTLSLSVNSATNLVYSWLSNFSSSLVYLDLSHNILRGPVPSYAFLGMNSLHWLDLSYNKIDGIPNFFSNMSSLQLLDMSENNLSGQISDLFNNIPICNKNSLEFLDLRGNKLVGPLPEMTQFSSLRTLDLSENKLNGTLTASIGHLSRLETLAISSNYLEGMISEVFFTNLSRLRQISFSSNLLSFNFSSDWAPPFKIHVLEMANSKLGPEFPRWFKGQDNCSVLDLSNAGIGDTIPTWFWDQSQELIWLNLSHNNLKGNLPDLSIKLAALSGIDLSSNSFEGQIPLFPPSVVSLDLSKNKFSGTLSFLCSSVENTYGRLDLSDNHLSGKIPDSWTHWTSYNVIALDNNNLSGEFPESKTFSCTLQTLHLRNNSFSGTLPSSLKICNQLKIIDVGKNRFSGTIPTWIGINLSNLVVLNLRSNEFYGSIPLELCHLVEVQILDFSLNNISGTIPRCLHNLTAMAKKESSDELVTSLYITYIGNQPGPVADFVENTLIVWKGKDSEYRNILGLVKSIDFSSNRLHGEIPEEIASLVKLVSLNLSRNSLTGTITPRIGELNRLNSLDLSNNKLSGKIPSCFSNLSFLGVLDLSNNSLSGKIPLGTQLQSFNASAYIGNPGLCGSPLLDRCPGEESAAEKPVYPEIADEEKLITPGFYVSVGLGSVVGFFGVFGPFLVKNRHILCTLIKSLKPKNIRP